MSEITVEDAVGAVAGNYKKWIECSRKRAFCSRKVASDAAKGLRRNYGKKMDVYRCSHCGLFHLATARGKRSGKG
jgi:hypothetical protein